MLLEIEGGVVSPRRQSLSRRARPYITNEDSLISGGEDFEGSGDTKELVQPWPPTLSVLMQTESHILWVLGGWSDTQGWLPWGKVARADGGQPRTPLGQPDKSTRQGRCERLGFSNPTGLPETARALGLSLGPHVSLVSASSLGKAYSLLYGAPGHGHSGATEC